METKLKLIGTNNFFSILQFGVKDLTRDNVVPAYVHLITAGNNEAVRAVNKIILSKWKPSGLIYIKEKAWKIVENKKKNKVA